MPKARPTQKDVAAAAEVSQSLVSQVLNHRAVDVSEATRQRILTAARRLGYLPRKESDPVGIPEPARRNTGPLIAYVPQTVLRPPGHEEAVFDAYEEYYNRFQNRLVTLAHQKGVSLLVRPYVDQSELTSWLLEWGVDGVVLHASDRNLCEWISKRYPMVQISRRYLPETDAVMSSQEEVISLAMKHLYDLGHRRIALFSNNHHNDTMTRRHDAYHDYVTQAELENFLFFDQTPREIIATLDRLGEKAPTAVIAGDPTALALQKEMLRMGRQLPEELSVVGIDNISADALADPPLTSIDFRAEDIMRVALSLLLNRLKEPTLAFQRVEISPRLVVRESTTTPYLQKTS